VGFIPVDAQNAHQTFRTSTRWRYRQACPCWRIAVHEVTSQRKPLRGRNPLRRASDPLVAYTVLRSPGGLTERNEKPGSQVRVAKFPWQLGKRHRQRPRRGFTKLIFLRGVAPPDRRRHRRSCSGRSHQRDCALPRFRNGRRRGRYRQDHSPHPTTSESVGMAAELYEACARICHRRNGDDPGRAQAGSRPQAIKHVVEDAVIGVGTGSSRECTFRLDRRGQTMRFASAGARRSRIPPGGVDPGSCPRRSRRLRHVLDRLAGDCLLELVRGHRRFDGGRSVHTPSYSSAAIPTDSLVVVRMNGLAISTASAPFRDRERNLADEIARCSSDDGAADQRVRLLGEDQLGEASSRPLAWRVPRLPREIWRPELDSWFLASSSVSPGQRSQDRCTPPRGSRARRSRISAPSGFRCDVTFVHALCASMGQLGDIANRVDVRNVGAHLRVHGDEATLAHCYAGGSARSSCRWESGPRKQRMMS